MLPDIKDISNQFQTEKLVDITKSQLRPNLFGVKVVFKQLFEVNISLG